MSTTYGKSTYQKLIDDIRFDLNEPRLTQVADEAIQHYILRAEEDICKRITIEEQWSLALVEDQAEYAICDRPAITAMTLNGSFVATFTAAGHGLVTGDEIYLSGVQGITLDTDTYTVTVAGNNVTLDDSVGSGTYVSGGRFWKTSEIPTYFSRFHKPARREVSGFVYEIQPASPSTLLDQERQYATTGFDVTQAPALMALQKSPNTVLKFWPAPVEDEDITLIGVLAVRPSEYHTDALTGTIILSSEYDDLIKYFCQWKLYRYLKEFPLAKDSEDEYLNAVQEMRRRSALTARREVRYT